MKKNRILSGFIAIIVAISSIGGLSSYSQDTGINPVVNPDLSVKVLSEADIPETVSSADIEEFGHIERLREEEPDMNTVIFKNSDGTNTMYYFGENVKYTDENGTVRDKSTTLSECADKNSEKYAYLNPDNDVNTYFPKELSGKTGILLKHGDFAVEILPMGYIGESKTISSSQAAKAEKVSESLRGDEKNSVVYSGVFGASTHLRYLPTLNGFKEEIVLEKYSGTDGFRFSVKTNGASLKQTESGWSFVDAKTGETTASMSDIIVFDGNGEMIDCCKQLIVETITENSLYTVTIVLDDEIIADENCVYPLTVDPTITVNASGSGTSKTIIDAPIYTNSSVAQGGNGLAIIGYHNASYYEH